jgi:hypothetical protein
MNLMMAETLYPSATTKFMYCPTSSCLCSHGNFIGFKAQRFVSAKTAFPSHDRDLIYSA